MIILNNVMILYGKVVIVLKVIYYIYINRMGLVHILCRLHTFRLRFVHEYMYYDSHSCFRIAILFLTRVYNTGYSKQLFLLMPVKCDVSNMSLFLSKLNMWSLFSHQKVTLHSPVDAIPFEPLWYYSYS